MPDATCPSDAFFGNPIQPIVGDRTFKQIATYVEAGCTIVSIILCFGLAFTHLIKYRCREEQRQVVRIVVTPAIICIVNFFGTWFYDASGFILPIGEYYDAIALVSLYLLFVTYATPPEFRGSPKQLLSTYPTLAAQHAYQHIKKSSSQNYFKTYVFVFQIIPVRFITTIATMATYGTVCQILGKSSKGHIVLTIITTMSTILCFFSVLRFMKLVKPSLLGQHALFKTIALKGLVASSVLLNLVFSILKTANAIHPTSTLNNMDWFIGLPDLITCCIGLIFSIIIVIPYSTSPYSASAMPDAHKKNYFAALIDVLNFSDIIFVGLAAIPAAWAGWKSPVVEQDQEQYMRKPERPAYGAPAYNEEVPRPEQAFQMR